MGETYLIGTIFATAINVIHHVTTQAEQIDILNEIIRVLHHGGLFFLHEINTLNPIFKFYIGYIFPLLKEIDDGSELWIRPTDLPQVGDSRWLNKVSYFNFLPDFIPEGIMKRLSRIETRLEKSRFRVFSSHYLAVLRKNS